MIGIAKFRSTVFNNGGVLLRDRIITDRLTTCQSKVESILPFPDLLVKLTQLEANCKHSPPCALQSQFVNDKAKVLVRSKGLLASTMDRRHETGGILGEAPRLRASRSKTRLTADG